MLAAILMEKIPDELRQVITSKFDIDSCCIENVLEAFKAKLLAREKCHIKSNDDGGMMIGNNHIQQQSLLFIQLVRHYLFGFFVSNPILLVNVQLSPKFLFAKNKGK